MNNKSYRLTKPKRNLVKCTLSRNYLRWPSYWLEEIHSHCVKTDHTHLCKNKTSFIFTSGVLSEDPVTCILNDEAICFLLTCKTHVWGVKEHELQPHSCHSSSITLLPDLVLISSFFGRHHKDSGRSINPWRHGPSRATPLKSPTLGKHETSHHALNPWAFFKSSSLSSFAWWP